MPLYEYQCEQCGRFELIQKFSDAPLTECPKCGREVHKLLSAPAIQFKGTGWYITDYARKSSGTDGKSKDGASKDGASQGSKESATSDSSSKSTASKSTGSKEGSGSSSGSSKS